MEKHRKVWQCNDDKERQGENLGNYSANVTEWLINDDRRTQPILVIVRP